VINLYLRYGIFYISEALLSLDVEFIIAITGRLSEVSPNIYVKVGVITITIIRVNCA